MAAGALMTAGTVTANGDTYVVVQVDGEHHFQRGERVHVLTDDQLDRTCQHAARSTTVVPVAVTIGVTGDTDKLTELIRAEIAEHDRKLITPSPASDGHADQVVGTSAADQDPGTSTCRSADAATPAAP